MPRKCSVALCQSNYNSLTCEVTVYGFPSDEEELKLWLRSLPNVIQPQDVTKHMGVCQNHWPKDAPMVKKRRYARPACPPSIFPHCPLSLLNQTMPKTDRKVESRQLSLSKRNAQADEMEAFVTQDMMPETWDDFVSILSQRAVIANLLCVPCGNGVALITLSDRLEIAISITISSERKVIAQQSATSVSVEDLLGYQHCLSRWSQLDAIVNRVRHAATEPLQERQAILSKYKTTGLDDNKEFLVEQLLLSDVAPQGRRYSPKMMLHALRLYIASKAGYRHMRTIMSLPHPKTLKKGLGSLHTTGGVEDCKHTVAINFAGLSPAQLNCIVIFDEVYVKPSLRFRGGHIFGKAADHPECLATTVLAILVKPLLGNSAFIARLIPVRALNSDFLYQQLDIVVSIINAAGGTVRATICDNHFVNKQLYNKMANDTVNPYIGSTSTQPALYLLYDTTHLLKNVRNNWLNEACQQLGIIDPDTGTFTVGQFRDVISVWAAESENAIRTTTLSYASCYPSPLERQNFQHVAAVFNDKTVAALKLANKHDTARVVEIFLSLWKIVNVKSLSVHKRVNDPQRRPITSPNDDSIRQLQQLADSLLAMEGGRGRSRKHSLTNDTRDALLQTIQGLVCLAVDLLSLPEWSYVLLGMFQSDELEGEFGIYRQMCGGCYFITVDQILCTARFRKLNILVAIKAPSLRQETHSECCSATFTDGELAACDVCHANAASLSKSELAALYFICGYVAMKESIKGETSSHSEESEFTRLVSRGKLCLPPDWLFNFASCCFAVFKQCTELACCQRLVRLFMFLYESFYLGFDCNSSSVSKRLAKCFLKGLVTKSHSSVPQASSLARRKRKLA